MFNLFRRPRVIILREKRIKWNLSDAHIANDFFSSDVGEKVLAILEDVAINKRNTVTPSSSPTEIAYTAGMADGMAMLISKIKSLQPVPLNEAGESEQPDEGEDSASDL